MGPGRARVHSVAELPSWRCVSCFWESGLATKEALQSDMTSCEGLDPSRELTRDQGLPFGPDQSEKLSWQVYIDNFDNLEVVPEHLAELLTGTVSPFLQSARLRWGASGAAGNEDRDLLRELDVATLGERVEGRLGRRDPPLGYLLDLKVNEFREEIETISTAATQENVLEEMLSKVENAWKPLEFVVNPYKESKDVFILGGVDDVMAVLEETQVLVQTILGSRFVGPMQKRVDEWEKKILSTQGQRTVYKTQNEAMRVLANDFRASMTNPSRSCR